MWIDDWPEFFSRAKQIANLSPARSRFTLKYDHSGAVLVFKVTDDFITIKYKTTEQQHTYSKIKKLTDFFAEKALPEKETKS